MASTKNFKALASNLMLISIILGIPLTHVIAEDNYKNDNNFLTHIFESTRTENGYKTSIIVNPDVIGICATENGYKLDLTINTQGIGGSHKENNYKLDLIPEKTFLDIPDVAVTKIAPSKTIVGQGYTTRINVTVSNQALNYETFHVIIHANTTTIKTQIITVTSRDLTTITFTWNTTGVAKGNYTVTAEATTLPGETDTTDNTLTGGWIIIAMVGDINADGIVDISDVYLIALAFGAMPPDPRYNSNLDIIYDEIIDISDIYIAAIHFGEIDP